MADRKPFVGAIVHRKQPVGCVPGIVTVVHPDGSVDMNCFGPTGPVPHIRLPQGDQAGAWHYPCDEPPHPFVLRQDWTPAELGQFERDLNEAFQRHPSHGGQPNPEHIGDSIIYRKGPKAGRPEAP